MGGPVPARLSFLRGITLTRLALLAGVCLLLAARPAFWDLMVHGNAATALNRWWVIAGSYAGLALPMLVLIVKADVWTAQSSREARVASLAMACIAGAFLFVVLLSVKRYLTLEVRDVTGIHWRVQTAYFARNLVIGGLFACVVYLARSAREAQHQLSAALLARIEIERQATESRLRLLEAQIEPHFLFNSLASIQRLYDREPARARSLMRHLLDYLRTASAHSHRRQAPLGDELQLTRSFLAIFQVRMGERLRICFDVPPGLEAALVPPLMVGTLVENAIKHGIAPREAGGTVSVSARRDGESLKVAVEDDGVGFRERFGAGVGLSNIRARLAGLFADRAGLELRRNAERGITAELTVPFRVEAVVAAP
jgi:sensor histidine kinase YesM